MIERIAVPSSDLKNAFKHRVFVGVKEKKLSEFTGTITKFYKYAVQSGKMFSIAIYER